ncbi:haloacid dehalogenase-like hydrolase domain-containing protein 3 [Aplysia californica]|uniref:Haloacid dehalogenase-like hydrolase domain-containing protein 3 n=1 Tax=Aplysia californica TaxID=6500 RepID=A0ABM0JQE2_APLCA|nr:haloacid dehalogenase-like hydrolase domain-containing protein 3 [Aplysia californica]XP_005099105.1 haloacid dehalogenase-like hydrolase domain-containing protein 3 [Aplysia californica]XP_005099107.1 haloacid dehalogenase-like hydrolase domain-containing protein 3 [Aplysia californica]
MARQLLKLVTVDVTNTLIRVAGSPGRQYAYVARKYGVDIDETLLTGIFLKEYKSYTKKYPNFGVMDGMPANIWWSLLVKDCFRFVDSKIPEEMLDKISFDLYFHFTKPMAWDLLPGAVAALEDLSQYPVKLGVISNWDHRLYKVLMVLKLRQFFDFILPSYIIGYEKPNSIIFHQALEDGRCEPHEAVHFGDNIEKDFIGAKNVGMNAYLLASEGVKNDFLDQSLVVKTVQEFVDKIRPQLGERKADPV